LIQVNRLSRIQFFCVFAVTAIFTGCITLEPYIPSPEFEPVDHSFPITGEVFKTGNVVSVLERRSPFSEAHPLPEADILLTGVVRQRFKLLCLPFFFTHRLMYDDDDDTIWVLSAHRRRFRWNGTIMITRYQKDTNIEFFVHAYQDGAGKQFILREASLGQARLEAGDPLEILNGATGDFPFLIGYAHLQNNSYRIFAVLDNLPGNRMILANSEDWRFLHREIFFNPFQKFQLLNHEGTVVAELKGGLYTIYNTLPEKELESLKQAIALFVAYRHSISVLRNIDRWTPSMFYRFVYP